MFSVTHLQTSNGYKMYIRHMYNHFNYNNFTVFALFIIIYLFRYSSNVVKNIICHITSVVHNLNFQAFKSKLHKDLFKKTIFDFNHVLSVV